MKSDMIDSTSFRTVIADFLSNSYKPQPTAQSPTTSAPKPPVAISIPKPPLPIPQPPKNKTFWSSDSKHEKVALNILVPTKTPKPTGNREALKLAKAMEVGEYFHTYPKKCKSDFLKFNHLAKLYRNNLVDREMFLDFASVLRFQNGRDKDALVEETIVLKATHDFEALLKLQLEEN